MSAAAVWWLRRRGAGRILAWALGAFFAAIVFVFIMIIALLSGNNGCGGGQGSVSGKGIPPKLIPIYQAAAQRYKLGALGGAVLAAINGVETDFGRNLSVSSAGAGGWMQFIGSTWARYGVDADRDGRKDPYNPLDAIYAAANYLHASGAPQNWRSAIFAYNHAQWYVTQVLAAAQRYAKTNTPGAAQSAGVAGDAPEGTCGEFAAPGSYIFPIPRRVRSQWARIDMGQDMQMPYGTPLLAIGDGTITSTRGSFPCSTVLRLTSGPAAGRSIYYGHSGPSRHPAGTRVRAGQPITYAKGGSECLAGGLAGWLEIGWAKGDTPVANYCQLAGGGHCAGATPAGDSFHRFLTNLLHQSAAKPGKA